MSTDVDDAARNVGYRARHRGLTISTAESLTGGEIGRALGAAPDSSEWYSGTVTAYRDEVKFRALGVEEGPVITPECAEQMARGVLDLTGSDVAVSVTGVGGPGDTEGKPAGTVYIGVATARGARVYSHVFEGGPDDVVHATVLSALAHVAGALIDTRSATRA